MDEPQECCAKQNKPDAKDNILYNSIHMKCLEKANLQRQKINYWLYSVRGKIREYLQMDMRDLFGVMETF